MRNSKHDLDLDVLIGNESLFVLQNDKHHKQMICYI